MALQMQAPSLTRAPAGSPARLRSAFCAPPLLVRVRLPAPGRARSAAAARITMRFGRVETKQAYICRDCGWVSLPRCYGEIDCYPTDMLCILRML
uniref:Uncharacterized protein n=1 Tax=Aegilops tauschii subsp. strangulata TaxID=200361 RepID=A0A453HJX0_AEGTS